MENPILASGFRVHYFRDLSNAGTVDLHTIVLTSKIPMSEWSSCPACKVELMTLVTFVAGNYGRRVRLGFCRSCGYIGYRDRPAREWIINYYTEDWDNAKARDIKKEAASMCHALSREQYDAAHFAEVLSVDKNRAICDIGCGNGGILEEFRKMGYNRAVGVENSRYRAFLAKERYGCEVLVGDFENPKILAELANRSPVGLFFSFHTLEHVYNPVEVIEAVSNLQKEGDYVILAMPDAEFEPGVVTLFWLPHLHAYTRVTIEKILNNAGYEVIADNFSYKRLMMVGRKTLNPKPRYVPKADYKSEAAARLINWFYLPSFTDGSRYRVWWTNKTYHTGYNRVSSFRAADLARQKISRTAQFFASRFLRIFNNERSLVISGIKKRFTDPEQSPVEIQYDKNIEFLAR